MEQSDYLCKEKLTSLGEVTERIMRQTLEAFLFEEIIDVARVGSRWNFTGKSASGETIHYSCVGEVKESFGRVKLDKNAIKRENEPCTDIYLFLEEVVGNRLEGAYVTQFIHELLETMAKDNQSKAFQSIQIPEQDKHYEALESHMVDGHPYHPSYKSRIGFSLKDNYAYGPEFNQEISLQWIAVHDGLTDVSTSEDAAIDEIYRLHLTDDDRHKFNEIMIENGCKASQYVIIPVHPWQLEHRLPNLFVQQLANKEIVILGASQSSYRAQQSIRTLSHRDNTNAAYIKLSLSITNTSTSRILAQHTTQNAPRISDWLHKIVQNDHLLIKQRFHILREVMGVSFRYNKLSPIGYASAYGTIGAIYRENVCTYLEKSEEAWPLNALSLTQKNGESFINAAIEQYGVDKWSDALIRTVMLPILHLLYGHGIALESHAQNIILVVEDQFPKSIIIKDLHDSVRYVSDKLLRPEWAPILDPEPETHRKFNRYSYLQTDKVSEVRDYTYDAFFFICMTDICFALESFGLSESDFWRKCVETIATYQNDHPEYKERFELFDLFSEAALIEEMTKRRIYGDGELYFRKVNNPLLKAIGVLG